MPEIINIMHSNVPSHFLIAAITLAEIVDSLSPDGPNLTVQLLVNGIEVSFVDTLNNLWERATADIQARVEERAFEMVSVAGLDGLRVALEDAEWSIREALAKHSNDKITIKE